MRVRQNVIALRIVLLPMVWLQTSMRCEISLKLTIGTVGDFLEQFKDHGYLTKLAVGGRQLEIRLVCDEDRIMIVSICHHVIQVTIDYFCVA